MTNWHLPDWPSFLIFAEAHREHSILSPLTSAWQLPENWQTTKMTIHWQFFHDCLKTLLWQLFYNSYSMSGEGSYAGRAAVPAGQLPQQGIYASMPASPAWQVPQHGSYTSMAATPGWQLRKHGSYASMADALNYADRYMTFAQNSYNNKRQLLFKNILPCLLNWACSLNRERPESNILYISPCHGAYTTHFTVLFPYQKTTNCGVFISKSKKKIKLDF